jgi:hypothetical protein
MIVNKLDGNEDFNIKFESNKQLDDDFLKHKLNDKIVGRSQ